MAAVFLGKDITVEIDNVAQQNVVQVSVDETHSEIDLELYGDTFVRRLAGQRRLQIEIQYAGLIPTEPALNEAKTIEIILTPTGGGSATTLTFSNMVYLGRRIGGVGANAAVPVTTVWAKSLT